MALGRKPIEIVEEGKHQLLTKAKHWNRIYLGKVAKIQNGYAFSSKNFSKEEGIPLIRIRDIDKLTTVDKFNGDYNEDFIVRKGDILVGMDGDFKAAYWKGENALLNQRVCRIIPNTENYNNKFLFLCLQPYLNAIHAETSAVTVKHISSKTIDEIPLPYPPIEEQNQIVFKIEELFSELDKGIEDLKTAQQQLKTYRQSVLKWAFEGKLTNENVKDGELPMGWSKLKIKDICDIKGGKNQKKVINPNGKYPIYGSSGIFGYADEYICDENTTIVGRKGNINSPLFVTTKFWNVDTAFGLCANEKYDSKLLFYFCLGFNFKKLDKSTTIPSLAKSDILSIDIQVPPLNEQLQIVQEIESRLSVADKMEESIAHSLLQAESLRQSILKKAFSGELV